jgi:hypothetical protein
VLTLRAYKHLGLTGPGRTSVPQIELFEAVQDDRPEGKAGAG